MFIIFIHHLNIKICLSNFAADDISDKNLTFDSKHDLIRMETPLPDWVIVGESVLVRPYSYSGVIAYVGPTEFASGIWIGVELDAPTGMDKFISRSFK